MPQGERALIVDPDAGARAFSARTLGAIFSDIEEADDGADALGRAMARPPALVVAEIRMPRIDGLQLCQLFRSEPKTSRVRIVMLADDAADEPDALGSGADAMLIKPVAPDQLRGVAAELLARSRRMREPVAEAAQKVPVPLGRAHQLLETGRVHARTLSRQHVRGLTTTPPHPPPVLRCPRHDVPLQYRCSYLGGVSQKFGEQWDEFDCPAGDHYRYRHRTRKLTAARND
ncbi:MAG: response regulator [Acidobacteria bacterium]|nr:response regulator [Acidobacteriota bacterium]